VEEELPAPRKGFGGQPCSASIHSRESSIGAA
jgi:hypothetical protein